MVRVRSLPLLAALLLLGGGCSALVDTDETRLGGSDAGSAATDAGGGVDAGPRRDAGPADDAGPGLDGAMPCSGPTRCVGGTLSICTDGFETTSRCPLGCATAGPRCAGMVPSNVPAELWDEGAEDMSLEGDASFLFDTSICRAMMAPSHIVSQADGGSEVCVLQTGAFLIGERATVAVRGTRPLVIMAAGEVRIDGVLDVGADLDEPGAGGFAGGIRTRVEGLGSAPGLGGDHEGTYDDGGGGGGGLCGAGGGGGEGASAAGGAGGAAADPAWELRPLAGGSGGGRGRGTYRADGTNAGHGGAGGGALQISTRARILVRGEIRAGGGGGLSGNNLFSSTINWGSGGGGGSGGALLLEAPAVRLESSATLRAAGGAGGGGAGAASNGEDGQNGSDVPRGRATGGVGADTTYGADGGHSGGGDFVDALDGARQTRAGGNGGGGGGGAGCVLVRNASGVAPGTGVVNPVGAPGYRTMPVLRD